MNTRTTLAAAALVAAISWPGDAVAQRVEHGRGKIVSIDTNRGTVDLGDPKGRVGTWRFNRNATVKFTDGGGLYPNPSVYDLKPPMYVHFTFRSEVIESFDVRELGFDPSNSEGQSSRKEAGRSRVVTGRVTAYDPAVRQVEVDHAGTRETFQLTDRSDQRLNAGDRVQLRTEWSGQRELVIETRVLGRDGDGGRGRTGGTSASDPLSSDWVEGRVVRISPRGVVMEVGGSRQSYSVDNARLLRELRVGDTVEFAREERNGRMYIVDVR